MKTNNRRRRYISAHQVNRVAMIITEQWEEVTTIVQERTDQHNCEKRILMRQTIQQYQLQHPDF